MASPQPPGNQIPERRDYRKEVTESIIQMLEQGVAPWQKPWDAATVGNLAVPFNPTSNNPYRGGNAIYLMASAIRKGYDDPRWMTYKQATANDWQIRGGEKGTQIEFWEKRTEGKDGKTLAAGDGSDHEETGRQTESRFIHRVYTVFNAKQIDRIPAPEPKAYSAFAAVETGEQILRNSGAQIAHDQADRAFYSRSTDSIHLPLRELFHDAPGYYGTALHELAHNAESGIMPRRGRICSCRTRKTPTVVGIILRPRWFDMCRPSVLLASSHSGEGALHVKPTERNDKVAEVTSTCPLGMYMEQFQEQLERQRYSADSISQYIGCISALGIQMKALNISLEDLDPEIAVGLIAKSGRPSYRIKHDRFIVRSFLNFLTTLGAAKPSPESTSDDAGRGLLRRDYEEYLRQQRGLSDRTIFHSWRLADRSSPSGSGKKPEI